MGVRARFNKVFSSSYPGKIIITRSRKTVLPGFSGFSLYEVWHAFFEQLKRSSLTERAGSISFNVVMAIPPTLIFIFTLIPYLPISRQFIDQLFALIRDIIPGERNNSVIIDFLQDFINQPRNELLSFGLLLAILFSSNAMMGVLRSFEKNYPGFSRRKMLQKRSVALQLTMIVFFLVFVTILLLIAQANVLRWLGVESEFWRNLIHDTRWVFVVLLTFWIVSFIYRHGPAVAKKWPMITPGAVFATTLMILATVLVTWWVNHFSNYNKLYGSIGAIFILMSLIYANSLAILVGFELNVTLTNLRLK
ncbi:MAG TPA: YihY/virulence factor BrkB family protein, partial [Chitinophagaceae bacterium]|nr:YihY/virulence factor BrkB family protein [Chitinophagaceae bacterium]